MAHGVHHRLEFGGVQAGLLVGAGQGLVQREVLFNDLCAQHGGGDVALPSRRVVRKPDRQAELVEQFHHGGQVGILIGGGVLGVAVQNRRFGAAVIVQHTERVGDLAEGAHAGRKQHRRAQFGDLLEIRQVGDLAGGDFQKRQPQRAEKAHAGDIERRGQVLDADGIAVFLELAVAFKRKVQLADHLQLAFGGVGGLLLVFGLFGKAADDKLRHGGLVFDDIRAAFFGDAGHLFGHLQIAVVVDAGFGNDRDRHGRLLYLHIAFEIRLRRQAPVLRAVSFSFTSVLPGGGAFFPVPPSGPYPSRRFR